MKKKKRTKKTPKKEFRLAGLTVVTSDQVPLTVNLMKELEDLVKDKEDYRP